jgi:NTE family protein
MTRVAVACQGGGIHAAFEVGVLSEILHDVGNGAFKLVGLSGTSAGALCALMAWYGLAPKNGSSGSTSQAIDHLNEFWDGFVASTAGEIMLNLLAYNIFKAEEREFPTLGVNAPIFSGLDPRGVLYKAAAACLPSLGVRRKYFDLEHLLAQACPHFEAIDWPQVKTRLLIGATEVVNGFETVFDSDVNKGRHERKVAYWRQRLRLSLAGIAAAGTLPPFRETEYIKGEGYYWDGLYSQNPPVREFIAGTHKVPDELWIIRINPQQWPEVPTSNADIKDRTNELMGNLSLQKELDFILQVNKWHKHYKHEKFGKDHKHVTVRTIKMTAERADSLRYSSKFNRDRAFMEELRAEGRRVARDWLNRWPDDVGCYPEDAAYRKCEITNS